MRDWNQSTTVPARSPCSRKHMYRPSEVCQWFRGELGESVVVKWDQNRALRHQLNSPCLEEEECCLWPQEHHPHRQTWRWKHYALGCSAKGTGQLHRIKRDDGRGHVPLGPEPLKPARALKNGSWMGYSSMTKTPKTHGQGNKGVVSTIFDLSIKKIYRSIYSIYLSIYLSIYRSLSTFLSSYRTLFYSDVTVPLCIRQGSKINDDSVSVEELDWYAESQVCKKASPNPSWTPLVWL